MVKWSELLEYKLGEVKIRSWKVMERRNVLEFGQVWMLSWGMEGGT